jgi:hypothetical protein
MYMHVGDDYITDYKDAINALAGIVSSWLGIVMTGLGTK